MLPERAGRWERGVVGAVSISPFPSTPPFHPSPFQSTFLRQCILGPTGRGCLGLCWSQKGQQEPSTAQPKHRPCNSLVSQNLHPPHAGRSQRCHKTIPACHALWWLWFGHMLSAEATSLERQFVMGQGPAPRDCPVAGLCFPQASSMGISRDPDGNSCLGDESSWEDRELLLSPRVAALSPVFLLPPSQRGEGREQLCRAIPARQGRSRVPA